MAPLAILLMALLSPVALHVHAQGFSAARAAAVVKMKPAHVLSNAKGMTLYVFAPDPKGKSTCYNSCAKFWPPAVVASGAKAPKTISGIPGTFGVTTRKDGTHQLTYDGAPLYTFAGDKDSGDMYGQGLFASGGFWWAVVAAGKAS
jgi:predicted lipoprotein with Yx(FWY)xxD motif